MVSHLRLDRRLVDAAVAARARTALRRRRPPTAAVSPMPSSRSAGLAARRRTSAGSVAAERAGWPARRPGPCRARRSRRRPRSSGPTSSTVDVARLAAVRAARRPGPARRSRRAGRRPGACRGCRSRRPGRRPAAAPDAGQPADDLGAEPVVAQEEVADPGDQDSCCTVARHITSAIFEVPLDVRDRTHPDDTANRRPRPPTTMRDTDVLTIGLLPMCLASDLVASSGSSSSGAK